MSASNASMSNNVRLSALKQHPYDEVVNCAFLITNVRAAVIQLSCFMAVCIRGALSISDYLFCFHFIFFTTLLF